MSSATPELPAEQQAERDIVDRSLLRAIAQQDRPAFEKLYRDYHRRLGRFLARVTQRDDLIEEVVNDTFWIVWRKAEEFRGQSLVSTWIMGIAYRCALKALRRAGPPPLADPVLPIEDETQWDDPLVQQDRRSWIMQGLERLPPDQRTTLLLAYYLGHSCEEISEIMACPVGTVKARMFHARIRLRNLLPTLGGMNDGAAYEVHR
ncbi:MAG: polymerase sigma70 [Hydrocarboniphaga sp.]|uniref:RNA polymerase sigma factor n=1 Tax=Hydrocarboniphaga sp. TaxID=2033016 RepID=UPI002623B8E7|nr:sigma-70 family RNA polymerase sigma factor [Hydrocarboniphaga sp.]MDB5973050.1 polymerase sigma70 [Hydrocarboniphaga sp.]